MKLGFRPEEAADVLGSQQLLAECEAAGWITPKIRRHRLTVYDFSDLANCWRKICAGQLPPPMRKQAKEEAES